MVLGGRTFPDLTAGPHRVRVADPESLEIFQVFHRHIQPLGFSHIPRILTNSAFARHLHLWSSCAGKYSHCIAYIMAEVAPAKANGVAKGAAAEKKAPVERPQKPDEESYKKELERLEKELSKAQERFVSGLI